MLPQRTQRGRRLKLFALALLLGETCISQARSGCATAVTLAMSSGAALTGLYREACEEQRKKSPSTNALLAA